MPKSLVETRLGQCLSGFDIDKTYEEVFAVWC